MKHKLIALACLMAVSISAQAKSIVISSAPNITRNAGTAIPLTFTASGFAAGSKAQIWLVNAKTWAGDVVEIDVPIVNGVNTHPVLIPWSWGNAGPYVVKVVSGTTQCWDTRVITIRTAVLWPYAGTVFPANGLAIVTWVTSGGWDLGDFMEFSLQDQDTGQVYPIGDFGTDPYAGWFQFWLPYGVKGEHFRVIMDALEVYQGQDLTPDIAWDDGGGETEVVQSTKSAVIAIR